MTGGPVPRGAVAHPSAPTIDGFGFDDAGRPFVAGDGRRAPGDELPSGIDGQPVRDRLTASRSSHARDPVTMDVPGWRDAPADEVVIDDIEADCPGDVDADGRVDVTHRLAVLAAWGACFACDGDLDWSGAIGVPDQVGPGDDCD